MDIDRSQSALQQVPLECGPQEAILLVSPYPKKENLGILPSRTKTISLHAQGFPFYVLSFFPCHLQFPNFIKFFNSLTFFWACCCFYNHYWVPLSYGSRGCFSLVGLLCFRKDGPLKGKTVSLNRYRFLLK